MNIKKPLSITSLFKKRNSSKRKILLIIILQLIIIRRAKKYFKLIIFKKIKCAPFKEKIEKIIFNIKINNNFARKKNRGNYNL